MWGRPTQVAIAKRELLGLMEHILRDIERRKKLKATRHKDPKEAWKKVKAAPSDRKQQRIEEHNRELARRKRLRHPPPKPASEFDAIGSFLWPSKETNPQDSLGMSFEMLDDIRFECSVFINYIREKGIFLVLGDDPDSVQKAVDRMFGKFCEIAARNRRPREKFLVHTPSMNLPGVSVQLVEDHSLKGRHVTFRSDPISLQALLSKEAPSQKFLDSWRVRREKLEGANFLYLKQLTQQALNDVLYFRGHATFKIHFGTLVLFGRPGHSPPDGLFSLEDFSRMMRDSASPPAGEVIRSYATFFPYFRWHRLTFTVLERNMPPKHSSMNASAVETSSIPSKLAILHSTVMFSATNPKGMTIIQPLIHSHPNPLSRPHSTSQCTTAKSPTRSALKSSLYVSLVVTQAN